MKLIRETEVKALPSELGGGGFVSIRVLLAKLRWRMICSKLTFIQAKLKRTKIAVQSCNKVKGTVFLDLLYLSLHVNC